MDAIAGLKLNINLVMISTPTISTPARVCQVYMTHKVYDKCKFYFSLADTTFKERDENHIGRPQYHENITKLAKYIYRLRCSNIDFSPWAIIK